MLASARLFRLRYQARDEQRAARLAVHDCGRGVVGGKAGQLGRGTGGCGHPHIRGCGDHGAYLAGQLVGGGWERVLRTREWWYELRSPGRARVDCAGGGEGVARSLEVVFVRSDHARAITAGLRCGFSRARVEEGGRRASRVVAKFERRKRGVAWPLARQGQPLLSPPSRAIATTLHKEQEELKFKHRKSKHQSDPQIEQQASSPPLHLTPSPLRFTSPYPSLRRTSSQA